MTFPSSPTPDQTPAAPSVQADATNRSVRTLAQGLLLDLAVAVALVLATAFTDIRWTETYWITLGLTLAKTGLQTIVAYVMRLKIPPVES